MVRALARYALAAAGFLLLTIGLPRGIRAVTGVGFDTTFLVILAMIASAWYLGRGPGLLMAVAFEGLLDYYGGWPKDWVRFTVIAGNRLLLFGSVVLFASARRQAEQRLKQQRAEVQATLERERAARGEAEKANRLKDQFLATVSHELRTPLNAMLGWATLLSRHQADESTRRRAASAIERAARAQAQIVDDILDVSRIVSGGLRIEPQRVALAALIEEAVDTMRVAAAAKEIALVLALDGDTYVLGDPPRLRQVAWNLIANAIKFTPAGGRIDVRLTRDGGYAQLEVQDTGAGITPEFFPYLFERFRQADSSMTREQGGLGLGLSIVKHLAELHGGTVSASSPGPGKGSTFTVRLPTRGAEKPGAVELPFTTSSL